MPTGAQRAERGNPTVGMNLGVTSCDSACEQTWKPLLAADNAVPEGYWTVFTRADGKKHWGYYGYALYSYAAEGPGQITGHLIYDDVHPTSNCRPTAPRAKPCVSAGARPRRNYSTVSSL